MITSNATASNIATASAGVTATTSTTSAGITFTDGTTAFVTTAVWRNMFRD